MKIIVSFIQSVLGGVMIAIGGIAFLSVENRYLGSFLFAVGLFVILTMGFNLFTGKVCNCLTEKPHYIGFVAGVWLGNFVGTSGVGLLIGLTRAGTAISVKAAEISQIKLNDNPISLFILAIFCNIMIYISVASYNKNPHPVGKYLGLVFGIMVFILAGFEHCVANMFYFTAAGVWSIKSFGLLLLITLGNAVGGLIIPAANILVEKSKCKS